MMNQRVGIKEIARRAAVAPSTVSRVLNNHPDVAAETYQLHAEQDEGHGGRQIDAIRRFATDDETQEKIRGAVQLGVNAFNFEWDGHVQAMTSQREHWRGNGALTLRQPRVALPR